VAGRVEAVAGVVQLERVESVVESVVVVVV
jgi:hypothetical protein